MALKLFNTLTRKKEEFKPIVKGKVGYYACGPTTYNYPHIGNYRAFIFYDVLRRVLEHKGFEVKHVSNITDVDDKTIKGAREAKKTLAEFTEKYNQAYIEDLKTLNIKPPHIMPKATEHIGEMVQIIKALEKKGLTYKGEDGIYFSISKFKDYGKLSGTKLKKLKAGARIREDTYDKENAADFVLWKFYKKEDGDVYWNTEYGKGRPGWHIECSAMASKYLGKTFDIHAGGIDLIFPHHENEIAQSEGASGKPFAKCWLHNEFILVDGKKMSKSLGNFYTLRDVLEKGYEPKAIRYLLLSPHYRQQLNFTFSSLEAAKSAVDRVQEAYDKLKEYDEKGSKAIKLINYKKRFEEALDDDLNMPEALAVIFDLVKELNTLLSEGKLLKKDAKAAVKLFEFFDEVLGILKKDKEEIPEKIIKLAEERSKARKNKDFKKADELRKEISKLGYHIDDSVDSYRIKKS